MDAEARLLAARLAERLPTYGLDVGRSAGVRWLGVRRRERTRLHRFEVGDRPRLARLVVKVQGESPLGTTGAAGLGPGRPRLAPLSAPLAEPLESHRLEFEALRAVEEHFRRLADARFGAIRALDLLDAERAIVMLEAPGVPLSRLLLRASRPGSIVWPIALESVLRDAGAWLREYHGIAHGDRVHARLARPADLSALAAEFAAYLGRRVSRRDLLVRAADAIALAAADLPDPLPLGLAHGDFAMRNVLVGPARRVTILDTRARWLAPPCEDLAQMLVALRTSRPQVITQGLLFADGALGRLGRALLAGYLGQADGVSGQGGPDAVEHRALRVFELLVLLDKWSALVERRERGPRVGGSGAAGRIGRVAALPRWLTARLTDRTYAALAALWCDDLAGGGPGRPVEPVQ